MILQSFGVLFILHCMVVLHCVCFYICVIFFFFKQKTAYEMRISDWSSDVCSSDLTYRGQILAHGKPATVEIDIPDVRFVTPPTVRLVDGSALPVPELAHLMTNGHIRSEEHTSELQSLMRISYAVFC